MSSFQTQPKVSAQQSAVVGTSSAAIAGAWWKYLTGVLMAFVIYGAFFIAKGAKGFGGVANSMQETSRIVFFHVPVAILSSVCYAVATVYAVFVLRENKTLASDGKAAAAMELGFLFCILTTITGSIFSRAVWGAYWTWDPAQTRIVFMLLLYASYLVLRAANSEHPNRRARLSAVYTIITLVPAFFLIWIVPRIIETFHPTTVLSQPKNNSADYNIVLLLSFIAFNALFVWLFQLRCRIHDLTTHHQLAQMQE